MSRDDEPDTKTSSDPTSPQGVESTAPRDVAATASEAGSTAPGAEAGSRTSTPRRDAGRRSALRWGLLIALVVGYGLLLVWIWQPVETTRQFQVTNTIVATAVAALLAVVWLVTLAPLPRRWRRGGLAVVVTVAVALPFLVRIRGVTGDLLPILDWRWSPPEPGLSTILSGDADEEEATADVAAGDGAAASPQFLGPSRDGTLEGIPLARDWEARPPRQVWRRQVGAGWGSFAVVGDLAITQEQRGPEELVVAYDLADGSPRWAHGHSARYDSTIAGVGPRATPAVADGRVYAMGATGILDALDLATGELLWSHDVIAANDARLPDWGKSSSPLVVDGLVVVSAGGPDRSLVAYDAVSGDLVWGGGDARAAYASPLLANLDGVRQILILNHDSVDGHDPVDGDVLWSHPWPRGQPNVAQPLALSGDRVLVSAGYGVGAKMFRVSRNGGTRAEELEAELLWESPFLKAKFAHYVVHDGHVYGLDDGVMVCLDPETGERVWKRGRYGHGQLLLVDDLILLQAESGEVVLIEPTPEELRELTRFRALDDKTWNVPTLLDDRLLVRNDREAALFEMPVEER